MRTLHCLLMLALWAWSVSVAAHTYHLEHAGDSLSWLVLATDSAADRWQLPYPTYRLAVGDVDGDGRSEALVGVVKPTRYDSTVARRLFILDRKSTRLNSSHANISYAVFCLKKKKNKYHAINPNAISVLIDCLDKKSDSLTDVVTYVTRFNV